MQFNPTNYPLATPVPADTVLLRQSSTGRIRSALVSAVANAASAVQVVNSIADLKAVSVDGLADDAVVIVLGYYEPGDGGDGEFSYDAASSSNDNGGTIIEPDVGSGRWLRVYSGFINLKWFGAKIDGSTDDTVPFAAALLAATGSTLFVTPGNCRITSNINIPGRTRILGSGQESTTIYYRPTVTTLNSLFSTDDTDNVRLERITLYFDSSGGGNNGRAFSCDGATDTVSDVKLIDVNIDGFHNTGLYLSNVVYISLMRVRFIRCKNTVASGGSGAAASTAIRVAGVVNGIHVYDCRFQECDAVVMGGTITMYNWVFRDSYFEQNGNAAAPAVSDVMTFTSVVNVVFAGNYVEGNLTGTTGNDAFLRYIACSGIKVSGNMLVSQYGGSDKTRTFAYISGASRGALFDGNHFENPINKFVAVEGSGASVTLLRNVYIKGNVELTDYDDIMDNLTAAYSDLDRPFVDDWAPGAIPSLGSVAQNITVQGARVDRNDVISVTLLGSNSDDLLVTATILSDTLVRITLFNVTGAPFDPGTVDFTIRVFKEGL